MGWALKMSRSWPFGGPGGPYAEGTTHAAVWRTQIYGLKRAREQEGKSRFGMQEQGKGGQGVATVGLDLQVKELLLPVSDEELCGGFLSSRVTMSGFENDPSGLIRTRGLA